MEWVLLIIVVVLASRVGWYVWSRRTTQRRIREWADENQLAILRLRYEWSWGSVMMFWVVGWIPFYQFGVWHVTVQDRQGGQRDGFVQFGPWWWLDLPWRELRVKWR